MPQIRPYESQVSPTGGMPSQSASPNDFGGPGLTNLGQATLQGAHYAGYTQQVIQENATRAAVTDVHTMLAGAKAEYTKQALEFEAKADPKDTNLWDQFYHGGDADAVKEGTLKWYLDSYRDQITDGTARQAFDRGAADLTSQFGIHFAQVQSRMAGVHAKNQAVKMIDSYQTAVQSDPSQYESVMAAAMKAIDDPASDYGRAGFEQRDKIKQMATNQIASSTVRGMIGDSPQHALHSLEKGEWDNKITGEQKIALLGAAETGVRAQEVEKRRAEAELLRQKKAAYDATDQSLGAQHALNIGNPGSSKFPPVTATQVGKLMLNDELDGPTGRAWLSILEVNAERGPRKVKSNPVVERDLFRRIYLPDGDPKKIIDTGPIYDKYLKLQLDDTDMARLRDELVKSRSPEGSQFGKEKADFLKGIEPSITHPGPMGMFADPTTPEKFYQYTRDLDATIARYHKEGKDPRTLFDPYSSDYFGKIAKSSKYQNTGFGSITPQVQAPAPSAEPRKSLDDIFGVKK